MTDAAVLAPALRAYRGGLTTPERWSTWTPREGDILVCTPPKCGTTWTQTILSMLVHGGPDLPARLPVLSPWIDVDLGVSAEDVTAELQSQTGRRVVKTHTPADGFPIWQGVHVICVYRHPLDVFFSLRKHVANMKQTDETHIMRAPVPQSFAAFLEGGCDVNDFDADTLATMTTHYELTALSDRLPSLHRFHYADMIRDGRATVAQLAKAANIDADADLIDRVTEATAFGAMKAKAADYAPVGGTGFWNSDAGFFDSASSNKWEGRLSDADVDAFLARLAELIPDKAARDWLLNGTGLASAPV